MCRVMAIVMLALLVPGSSQAQYGSIVMSDDQDGYCGAGSVCDWYCCVEAPLGHAVTFYILALPTPIPMGGFTHAEFRVRGKPASGLVLTSVPNPAANVVLGDPFADETKEVGSQGGTNIAFPTCQMPNNNGIVPLFTVTALNLGLTEVVALDVDHKDPPSNLNWSFPLFSGCDAPVFTAYAVYGGYMELIPSGVLPVETRPWSAVKSLYQ